jgi:ABC-2 type transport system ATP-binding protein
LSSPPPEPAIFTQGLTKRFGTLTAVDRLDLSVHRGEAFALVGPDGAGKTTTLRLLVGIMDPDEGQARILGLDTVRQAGRIQEYIGYMPQRFGLYDDLTVAENLAFYADLHRVPPSVRQERTPELLAFANLTAFQDRLAAHLSGGMRQKLGLICALIHTPQVLFLDEPTFGVDPVSRREFWQILYQLLGRGITIFLSTAYLDEAERAHRVGLINQGRLLVADTPSSLKATFQGDLLELRGAELRRAKKILRHHPLIRQSLAMGERLMLSVESAPAALEPVARALMEAGLQDFRLAPAAPGLEDLFVQIVRQERE